MKYNIQLSMKQYHGHVPNKSGTNDPQAVGRLFWAANGAWERAGESNIPLLLILRSGDHLSEELYHRAVGLVVCEKKEAEDLAKRGSVPVICLSEPVDPQEGVFALLDAEVETLTLSPDLSLLSAYCAKVSARQAAKTRLRKAGGAPLECLVPLFSLPEKDTAQLASGYWYSLSETDEEACFEAICDLAQPSRSLPVTVRLSVRHWSEEQIASVLRGLYRGAVYTRLSLLWEGADTVQRMGALLSLGHRIFCELSEEAREFNGYVPKGFLVDTPLLSLESELPRGADFFCFDAEAILTRLGGAPHEKRGEDLQTALEDLLAKRLSCRGEKIYLEHVNFSSAQIPAFVFAPSVQGLFFSAEEIDAFCRTVQRQAKGERE